MATVVASESARDALVRWAEGQWRERAEAVSFTRTQYRLDFAGKSEFGARSVWWKLFWVITLPIYLPYALLSPLLESFGVPKVYDPDNRKPGTVRVVGDTKNAAALGLIEATRKMAKVWLVFSPTKLAVVSHSATAPVVIWATDAAATVRFAPLTKGCIEILWPDKCKATLYPEIDARNAVTAFVAGGYQK